MYQRIRWKGIVNYDVSCMFLYSFQGKDQRKSTTLIGRQISTNTLDFRSPLNKSARDALETFLPLDAAESAAAIIVLMSSIV